MKSKPEENQLPAGSESPDLPCSAFGLPEDPFIESGKVGVVQLFDKEISGRRVSMELLVSGETGAPLTKEEAQEFGLRKESNPEANELLKEVLLTHTSPEVLERIGLLPAQQTENQSDQ